MSRYSHRPAALAVLIAALAGCSAAPVPDVQALREPDLAFMTQVAPPGAEPGTSARNYPDKFVELLRKFDIHPAEMVKKVHLKSDAL